MELFDSTLVLVKTTSRTPTLNAQNIANTTAAQRYGFFFFRSIFGISYVPPSVPQRIYEELLDPSGENIAYLLISSDTGDVKTAAASELGLRRGGIYWVCPVTEDLPEKRFIPDGIEFYEVRV